MTEVGPTLRRIRQQRGMTLDQVAQGLGVKRQAVSKWELGGSEVSAARLTEIGGILGFTLELVDAQESPERSELRRLISRADEGTVNALLGVARHMVKDL